MKSGTFVLSFLILVTLIGCNGSSGPSSVTVKNNGVFEPISYKIDGVSISNGGMFDLDEYENDSGPRVIIVDVKNNTAFPMTDMGVVFDDSSKVEYSFEKDDVGDSNYPGDSGTCGSTLSPGASCTIALAFETTVSGVYTQGIRFKFKNLIEADDRYSQFKVLAGFPASLVYGVVEDQADPGVIIDPVIYGAQNFYFGQQVGPGLIPVVERTDAITYKMVLSVKNEGELRARSVQFNPTQTCSSKETGVCPGPGLTHLQTHTFSHDCPTILYSGQSCLLTIEFSPANTDPLPAPQEIRYITYIANSVFNYLDSPLLTGAVLNGYINTNSTEVRAIFETAIENLDFPDPIIVGNRVKKAYKINNNGFRHGIFRVIKFINNSDSSNMASCIAQSGSSLLLCYDETLTTPKTLEDFPFFVDDTQNCFSDGGESQFYMEVGTGCIFHLYFQPSILYTTIKNFDMSMQVEYDSRWKNAEFIIPDEHLQTTDASSLPAAKMEIVKVKLGDIEWVDPDLDFSDIASAIKSFDLGRMALLSPTYYTREKLTVTFQNMGGVDAINNTFIDGSGTTIPFSSAVPTGVNLGPHSPTYFEATLVNNSQCQVVMPGATCIINMNFAPIGLGTNAQESENMFDYIDADPYLNLKRFIMNYDDQALYSDTNLVSTVRDIPQRTAEAQLKAILVQKGYILPFHNTNPDWPDLDGPYGNEITGTGVILNIGTGTIPYMAWGGDLAVDFYRKGYEIIPTADPSAFGADFDCFDLIDFATNFDSFDRNPDPQIQMEEYADVLARTGTWGPLPKDKSCAISYKSKPNNWHRIENVKYLNSYYNNTPESEYLRMIDFDYNGDDRRERINQVSNFADIQFHYYDGDISDPGLDPTNTLQMAFGNLIYLCKMSNSAPKCLPQKAEPIRIEHHKPAELVVRNPTPLMSAVFKRGTQSVQAHVLDTSYLDFNPYDSITETTDFNKWLQANTIAPDPIDWHGHNGCYGSTLPERCPGYTIPSYWFYGSPTLYEDDPLFSLTLKSFSSITHADSVISSLPTVNINDYEYIFHFGTFHKNMNHNLNFEVVNIGVQEGKIFEVVETEFPEGGMDADAFTYLGPYNLASPGIKPIISDPNTWVSFFGDLSNAPTPVLGANFTFRINATTAGIYKQEIEIKYYNGVFADGVSGDEVVQNKKILLVAEILDDAPILDFTYQNYDVEVQAIGMPTVTFDPTVNDVPEIYNVGIPDLNDMIRFSGVKIENLPTCYPSFYNCTEDFYLRKKITMTNTSGSKLYNLQLYFKDSALALDTSSPDATDDIFINYTDCSNADAPVNSPTEHSRDPATLPAPDGLPSLDELGGTKDSCFIEVFYQPTTSSTSFSSNLIARFETQENQYIQQIIGLDFIAKDPAVVNVAGKDQKPINIGMGNVENSFPLNFGTVSMTNEPQNIVWNASGGLYNALTIVNPNANTKASFLKSYHDFLIQEELNGFNAGSPPPITYYPPPGDYYSEGTYTVVDILRTKYIDDSTRVNVAATEPCFVGDDAGGEQHFEKGFKNDTLATCIFVVTLNADINYIGNQLSPVDSNDMNNNFVRIWYYNNDRSSTAYMTLHFEGLITPNVSYKNNLTTGDDYFNVYATRTGEIGFEWDPMLEDNSSIGNIVGYRVYVSGSQSALFDPTLAIGLEFYDVTTITSFTLNTGVIPGKFYFFKIVPIRQNGSYNAGAFDNLGIGKFLSLSDISTLQVVSPPNTMEYNHELNVLVDRDLAVIQLKNYTEALSTCTGKPSLFLDKGGSILPYSYQLINEPIWDWLAADTLLSNYADLFKRTHWLKTPIFKNIDIVFSGVTGYDSGQSSQVFETDNLFYLRNPDVPTATVPMAKGGVIGTSYENYTSYVGDIVPYGMARCYVPLP